MDQSLGLLIVWQQFVSSLTMALTPPWAGGPPIGGGPTVLMQPVRGAPLQKGYKVGAGGGGHVPPLYTQSGHVPPCAHVPPCWTPPPGHAGAVLGGVGHEHDGGDGHGAVCCQTQFGHVAPWTHWPVCGVLAYGAGHAGVAIGAVGQEHDGGATAQPLPGA